MLVKQIVFAVPNLPDFLAHTFIHKSPEGGGVREDEIRLASSGWRATIRKMTDIAERKELLSEEGGFGITAIGLLETFSKAFGAGLKRYTPTDFRNATHHPDPVPVQREMERWRSTASKCSALRGGDF